MQANQRDYSDSDNDLKSAVAYRARLYSTISASHHDQSKKVRAEQIKQVLELCYLAEESYITYRKRFIAIKISKPCVVKDATTLAAFEQDWSQQGIEKIDTPQGVIYRLK